MFAHQGLKAGAGKGYRPGKFAINLSRNLLAGEIRLTGLRPSSPWARVGPAAKGNPRLPFRVPLATSAANFSDKASGGADQRAWADSELAKGFRA